VCLEPAADGAGSSTPAGWFCGGLDEAGDLVIGLSGFFHRGALAAAQGSTAEVRRAVMVLWARACCLTGSG
jgi:hypothetical protein